MKKKKCSKVLFKSLSRDSVGSVDDSEQGEGKVTTKTFRYKWTNEFSLILIFF